MSKVVSIKAHPGYRDAAALRVWLNEGGQDNFGTPVDMTRFIDSDNPDVQAMLTDLNSWCESLKGLPSGQPPAVPTIAEMSKLAKIIDNHTPPGVDFTHYTGKSRSLTDIIPKLGGKEYWEGGLRKGDFYNFGAVESPLLEAFPIRSLPGRGEMLENRTYLNNEFVKREADDANPST